MNTIHTTPNGVHPETATLNPQPSLGNAAAPPATTPVSPQPEPPIAILADSVLAELDALEAKLGLDIVIRPNDKAQIRSLNRISVKAMGLAADIVTSDPARFPEFQGLPVAAQYADAMGRVAARVTELATHVQKSVQNQRYPACAQVLALYGVVKGLSRVVENEVMREKLPLLAKELAPRRQPRKPKQTKAEAAAKQAVKQRAKRVAKATAIIAANSDPPPGTSPTTAAPQAASPAANGSAPHA